jgi:hypothetical protein
VGLLHQLDIDYRFDGAAARRRDYLDEMRQTA